MLKPRFDAQKPYVAVAYVRMSTDRQNPRSPDQQEAEIRRRLTALGLNWRIVKVYRDDGKSGRYLRKRPDFQAMMQDIRTGAVRPDLILVDTLERLARSDELPALRKDLLQNHGVLVLTADSGFADPTTPQGKAFGAFEALRATEENRIKAHQVLRGKRDLARRGYWPGGKRPFGYKLVSRMVDTLARTVELMRKATTTTGLRTTVNVINQTYETGRSATKAMKEAIRTTVTFHDTLPKWNYTIKPQIGQ